MGRIDFNVMRYLEPIHYRVLTAVEMGMKNHEVVPLNLIVYIVNTHRGAVNKALTELCKKSAVAYEKGRRYDGYRLTYQGYDFLALNALHSRNIVGFVFNKIGVGKESDVYVGADPEHKTVVIKLHRLGKTFHKLKEKRDYLCKRRSCSWLYMARLAAKKEFTFLQALHKNGFPVPRPVDFNRNTVIMDYVEGDPLSVVHELKDPETLYDGLMSLIVELAGCGLIHGDFNEFNIMLTKEELPILIDFPQMVSIDHANAKFYFDRDVQCIRTFFIKRFNYESELFPEFTDIERTRSLDVDLRASGFIRTKVLENDEAGIVATEGESAEEKKEKENVEDDYSSEEEDYSSSSCRKNERLANWIEDTQNRFSSMSFEKEQIETGDAGFLSQLRDEKKLDEASSTNLIIGSGEKSDPNVTYTDKDKNEEPAGGVSIGDVDNESDSGRKNIDKKKTTTVLSSRTSVGPECMRKRIISEIRAKEKRNRKAKFAKGKSSIANQRQKANMSVINEYHGWDD